MSICTIPINPISKFETQNWVETTSESDEVTKQEKSFSPMSITSEVISDDWEKKNNDCLLEMKVKMKRIQKLKKELKKSSEKISNLIKEKKILMKNL